MNNIEILQKIIEELNLDRNIYVEIINQLGSISREIAEKNNTIIEKNEKMLELQDLSNKLIDKNATYRKMISSIIDSDDILGMR